MEESELRSIDRGREFEKPLDASEERLNGLYRARVA